jgi:D-serine deaminase-like pyridoxal phosphate-dependent protein
MHLHELETPSVLIDLDIMERNIARMQARCDALGLKFRPHTKTHKIPAIAKMQLEAGAVGIACQKVTEAQVFAEAGISNIQIPYNILGATKTAQLADLALYNQMTVAADDLVVVEGLSQAAAAAGIRIRVMADLATDILRTGAPVDAVVEIARKIDSDEHLHFAGLLVYPSNAMMRPAIQETLDKLNQHGIGVDTVSGGGFGAAMQAHEVPELTELRVGTYVFSDWGSVCKGWSALDDCAMMILTTVVSRPSSERAILDAGSKTLAADRIDNRTYHNPDEAEAKLFSQHGLIREYPDARLYQLSEEHGHVDLRQSATAPSIGERVRVIPVHTCVVTNLHDQIYGVRGETVEVTWPVAARGRVW